MASTTLSRKDARSGVSNRLLPTASWAQATPVPWAQAAQWIATGDGWRAWQKHLSRRPPPRDIGTLLDWRRGSLLWGAGPLQLDRQSWELLGLLTHAAAGRRGSCQASAEMLPLWLDETAGADADAALLEALGWCRALPALAGYAEAKAWWEMLERLVTLAASANGLPRHARPLAWQLAKVEIPLSLAWLFPEIEPCSRLVEEAASRLSESLMVGADAVEALPLASQLSGVRALLASWTRSLELSARLALPPMGDVPGFDQAVLQALRVTRPDGRQVFDPAVRACPDGNLFSAALRHVRDASVHAAAASLTALPPTKSSRKRRAVALPPPACHSEPAALGVLHTHWGVDAALLAVRYDGRTVQTELSVGKEVVLSGAWGLHIALDGKPLEQRSDWDQVCWVSDDDADYLELEARFNGGVRVQRQMLLARKERLLYLADAVLGQADAQTQYRGLLPLCESVRAQPAAETREVALVGRRYYMVQPPALPEWKRDPRGGDLTAVDGGLELRMHRKARRLYAPLVIDLDQRRARSPLTWRQLTVAEDRKAVPADIAVGYRVQTGKSQWLIYRALGPRGNRTVLGSNLVSEFMFARFTPDGEAEPLLEIE